MNNYKKTVLITGSSSGIGLAAAKEFSRAGWNVAATMRTLQDDHELTKFENVRVYTLDVTDQISIEKAFEDALKDFGQIHAVVNNAGYGVDGVFEAMSEEVIRKQFDTNVFGLMRVTQQAITQFRKQGAGIIIQVASMGGRVTFPLYSIYHGTKWAVEGFSESLSYELEQHNIKIKIIEPGVIKTEFYGSSRTFVTPKNDTGYEKFVNQVEHVSQSSGHRGESPEKVAKTILKAAESTNKKLRYVVGNPAPLLLITRRLLPDRAFMWLVRKSFRI